MRGITLAQVNEAYSSQCSPLSEQVSGKCANKSGRIRRGLYLDNGIIWNADSVGAFNILRIYARQKKIYLSYPRTGFSAPKVIKVAV